MNDRPPTVDEMDRIIRKDLILQSIQRIEAAELRHRESQQDPSSDADDRDAARHFLDASIQEFSFQWPNVRALLEEMEVSK